MIGFGAVHGLQHSNEMKFIVMVLFRFHFVFGV